MRTAPVIIKKGSSWHMDLWLDWDLCWVALIRNQPCVRENV
jgi:hypothetical protein